MEIVYAVDVKLTNDGEEFERVLAMDVSSQNILALTSYYLFASSKVKFSPHLATTSLHQTAKSSFCVYVCALEQPWHFCLIATSHVPIVHLVWSLDGTHLLICNQLGICRIFKIKNGCINTMENIYQYETNEDILTAKYIFHREPIIVNLDRKDSSFYGKDPNQSSMLQYALQSGNFVCVTSSGTVHTLPLNRSLAPNRYYLSQQDPLSVSLCDIFAIEQGFNVILGERNCGSLIHFFVVHYAPLEPKLSYVSGRRRGFRIPSCYGTLESLIYFQRHGNDCVLTRMSLSSGDLIDLYEYNVEQEEWISITLVNSVHSHITSVSLSPSQFYLKENEFQGHFGRQILIALDDGSILAYDKLNLKCKEQFYPLQNNDVFSQVKSEYFVRIQHTSTGACCLGLTQTGVLVLLRTMSLDQISSSSSMVSLLVHLFEQWIVQDPCPSDLWDLLCLIGNETMINDLVEQLVQRYDQQAIEIKRIFFPRFKQCLFHLHRLACPFLIDSNEHLTSLLVYQILLIVRDYLRLFIYEPNNRNFVETAQEILQQTLSLQNLDLKRVKYLPDHPSEPLPVDPRHYQLISFVSLINWISDLIFYLIGYLQLQQLPGWLPFKHFFTDQRQIQWLRELIIYFYILQKMNKISSSKIAHLQPVVPPPTPAQDPQQTTNTTPTPPQKDVLRDIFNSISKLNQKLEVQKTGHFDEPLLDDLSIFDVELLQSKADGMFPKSYPFLLPNCRLAQVFIRGQAPGFAVHHFGNPLTVDLISGGGSTMTPTVMDDDYLQETKFDVITVNKMSLTASSTFRRCLRCSNFSRVFKTKPYPFLTYRFNHRCICGGFFLLYTRTSALPNNNSTPVPTAPNTGNTNTHEFSTTATNR